MGMKNSEKAEKRKFPELAIIPCTVNTKNKSYPGMIIGKNIYYKDGSTWWEINSNSKKKETV